MSAELLILTATAVLAVVAICAAVIAVRAVRKVAAAAPSATGHGEVVPPAQAAPLTGAVVALHDGHDDQDSHDDAAMVRAERSGTSLAPRVVEGRLIVPPTQQQVVRTALGRPGVRLSVVVHGVAHALRAESRDRISALMRREYRRRRRERLQAGRRAVRASRPGSSSDQWLSS